MYQNADNENPFRNHRCLLAHIMSLRDDMAPNGWFNKNFKDRPTDLQIEDYLDGLEIKCDNQVILRKQRLERKKHGELACYFITISFDKCISDFEIDHFRIKQNMLKVLSIFRNTDYKWCEDPIAVCEFNGKTGFNPHIHIVCKKNYESSLKISTIRQGLQRKFQKEYKGKKNKNNYECYNVHMKHLPISAGEDYVSGLKQDNKQEYLDLDKKYREENGYDNLYYLFE